MRATLTPPDHQVAPAGAVAALLHRRPHHHPYSPILYVCRESRRGETLTRLLKLFGGELSAAFFPRWDGSTSDCIPASPHSMGRRMSVLRWLLDRENRPRIVVTTPEALLRRVPARDLWKSIHLEFRPGDKVEAEEVQSRLECIGYVVDERVDEPGEAIVRGRVIEVFPAAAPRPCRIELEAGAIVSIRSYDPMTQRSVQAVEHLIIDPASETIGATVTSGAASDARRETFFDYFEDASVVVEDGVNRRALDVLSAIDEDAEEDRAAYLSETEWKSRAAETASGLTGDGAAQASVPAFSRDRNPSSALRQFIEPLIAEGYRIVLAGRGGQLMRHWSRRLEQIVDAPLARAQAWEDVRSAASGTLRTFAAPIEEGFVDHDDKLACITLRDVAGQSAGPFTHRTETARHGETKLHFGDAVVHLEHGVGILEGLDKVGQGETELLRLRYADDAVLLVPMKEIGMIWRYGGLDTDITLDRLKSSRWIRRRDRTVMEIEKTAERMVQALSLRDRRRASPLKPDRVKFERFCANFPYDLTPDQAAATEAVAQDLASGRLMDRLLCGDVGFGKTEVALRAIAAAVFAGRQAAIVAPTTVLARQHFDVFRKRFARHGIEVAMLSRLQTPAEARKAKAGIADGSIHILVATHAICGKGVDFDRLALVVIDEEQRFGTRHKKAMRALASDLHVLAMTATPIPQTLQAGFVGLTDVSFMATPPRRRRPVRTAIVPFGPDTVATALKAEHERGGQSFVVCPRIEDLESVAERLRAMAPELSLITLHGAMTPARVDKSMLAFGAGEGDVLLATNIVESGLDVPGANTMVVCNPDRFGLAQLHQLRGRVGRGVRRALMLMAVEPGTELSNSARRRLEILEQMNALGSGFAVSSRDLDLRGAGELLGEEQAGHLQVIGLGLYRRMLAQAVAKIKGQSADEGRRPAIDLGISFAIPKDYIPQPEMRIELAAALDAVDSETALEQIREEFSDRFGAIPSELEIGFALASLRIRAAMLGICKLDGGPKAVAATLSRHDAGKVKKRVAPSKARDCDGRGCASSSMRKQKDRTRDSRQSPICWTG